MKYRVYWQPGCTSCLRAKEFLTARGIEFESINVREMAGAMDELASLGVRSVPVVARGLDFVFAQELRDLAEFLGVPFNHETLPPAELMDRLDRLLAAAQRYLKQLPTDRLDDKLPGRERDYLDLGYHTFVIPVAFLDAARGGELTEDHFNRKPPDDMRSVAAVVAFGDVVRADLKSWWGTQGATAFPAMVNTYYGVQPGGQVLERTCWHVAQHGRQLMAVLERLGIAPEKPLGAAELAGLPLPEQAWDGEIPLA